MNGYAIGTRCVITHMERKGDTYGELAGLRVGKVVTIVGAPFTTNLGRVHQEIDHPGFYSHHLSHWVDWMRPIDGDITNDDLDVVEMYKSRDVVLKTVKIPVSGRIKILGLP